MSFWYSFGWYKVTTLYLIRSIFSFHRYFSKVFFQETPSSLPMELLVRCLLNFLMYSVAHSDDIYLQPACEVNSKFRIWYHNNVYSFSLFILLFPIFLFVNIIQSASYSFCIKNEWKKVIENFGCAKKGCTFAPAFWEQRAAEIEKLNRERLGFIRIRLLPFARESVSQVASKKKFWKNFRKIWK